MNLTIRQNIKNMALSQYNNWFFDRGNISIGGKNIALKCDALCLIAGCADKASAINSDIQTGAIAFGDGEKRLRSVHVKGFFEDKSAIRVDYIMDSFTPSVAATAASTSAVGSGGGGSLKFNGVRTSHGEHLGFRIRNLSGKKFFISKITSFLVKGSRR